MSAEEVDLSLDPLAEAASRSGAARSGAQPRRSVHPLLAPIEPVPFAPFAGLLGISRGPSKASSSKPVKPVDLDGGGEEQISTSLVRVKKWKPAKIEPIEIKDDDEPEPERTNVVRESRRARSSAKKQAAERSREPAPVPDPELLELDLDLEVAVERATALQRERRATAESEELDLGLEVVLAAGGLEAADTILDATPRFPEASPSVRVFDHSEKKASRSARAGAPAMSSRPAPAAKSAVIERTTNPPARPAVIERPAHPPARSPVIERTELVPAPLREPALPIITGAPLAPVTAGAETCRPPELLSAPEPHGAGVRAILVGAFAANDEAGDIGAFDDEIEPARPTVTPRRRELVLGAILVAMLLLAAARKPIAEAMEIDGERIRQPAGTPRVVSWKQAYQRSPIDFPLDQLAPGEPLHGSLTEAARTSTAASTREPE